jgi:hypothetical protein
MKISSYNWNWWFISTILFILIGILISVTEKEEFLSDILIGLGFVSLIPCLYIGLKPLK